MSNTADIALVVSHRSKLSMMCPTIAVTLTIYFFGCPVVLHPSEVNLTNAELAVYRGVSQGSRLCMMCPTNTTNLEDGSYDCPVAVLPGASLAARYAVIVSFGVFLNGTSLGEIAQKVC